MLLGVLAVTFGELRWRQQLQARSWPRTTGTIIYSDLGSRWRRAGGHSTRMEYFTYLAYAYHVEDKRFVSRRISLVRPDLASRATDQVYNFIQAHPKQSSVDVFYDPFHPESAVLLLEVDKAGHIGLLCSGIALVIAGTFGLFLVRRMTAHVNSGRKTK